MACGRLVVVQAHNSSPLLFRDALLPLCGTRIVLEIEAMEDVALQVSVLYSIVRIAGCVLGDVIVESAIPAAGGRLYYADLWLSRQCIGDAIESASPVFYFEVVLLDFKEPAGQPPGRAL